MTNELSWQSLEQRRDYFLATLMFKCIHGIAPARLCNEIEMVFDRHGVNTRNANSLKVTVPKPNLECFKDLLNMLGHKSGTAFRMTYTMHHPSITLKSYTKTNIFVLPEHGHN